jgi:hypothetical protein
LNDETAKVGTPKFRQKGGDPAKEILMTTKRVGAFTFQNGSIFGPAQYMKEQGNARLDRILAGQDTVFNFSASRSPDIETAVLVALQTDYAGWKGLRSLFR